MTTSGYQMSCMLNCSLSLYSLGQASVVLTSLLNRSSLSTITWKWSFSLQQDYHNNSESQLGHGSPCEEHHGLEHDGHLPELPADAAGCVVQAVRVGHLAQDQDEGDVAPAP